MWYEVFGGIPQGSILGPILFIIFINDLAEVCNKLTEVFIYVDDAKLFKHIKAEEGIALLQVNLNELKI